MTDPHRNTYDPLTPVPVGLRAFTGRDAFGLWFSLGIGLLVLQAGSLLTPGLSLATALAAIVVGSAIGVTLLAATSVIGADTGLASMASLRPVLGIRGAAVPTVLNGLQLVGWGAFEIIVMRDVADMLTRQTFGTSSAVAWTLVFGALATALAVIGPLSFVRRFLRRYGLPLLLVGGAWLTWNLLATVDFPALFARSGTGALGFGTAVDLVVAMPLSWLPLIADYTRFGNSPRAMFRGTALGYFLANVWFYGLGATYALASGGSGEGMLIAALAMAGGGAALLLIIIDETDNVFADVHSAAVSAATLVRLPVQTLAVVFGAICTALALFVPFASYEMFLLLIGSLFASLFGVMLVDHFHVRRRHIDAAALTLRDGPYWFAGGFNPLGIAAWLLGVASFHAISSLAPWIGATVPALLIAATSYLLLVSILGAPRPSPAR